MLFAVAVAFLDPTTQYSSSKHDFFLLFQSEATYVMHKNVLITKESIGMFQFIRIQCVVSEKVSQLLN